MTDEKTFDEKLRHMTEAVEIEMARLRAVGNSRAEVALADLKHHPVSMVRLHDLLTKGIGNA